MTVAAPKFWVARQGARVVATAAELEPLAAVLAGEIERIVGVALTADTGDGRPGDVELRLDGACADGGYRLEVGECVVVAGADAAAVATGTASVLGLLGDDGQGRVPWVSVEETPRYGYRGLMIDCARHPQGIELLRDVVVLCRLHRINHLQLHLNDDEAFTFPSRRHPDLVTAERAYAWDDLVALDAFASARGVSIVPELDVPGHCAALTAARPDLFGHEGEVNRSVVHMARPAVDRVVGELIDEMCTVFPSAPWFHLGGDEVDLSGVERDPDAARFMAEHDLADAAALACHFAVRMRDAVRARGRRALMWEGLRRDVAAPVPRDVVFMPWDTGWYPPDAMLEDGFSVINASWRPLYVVGGGRPDGEDGLCRAWGDEDILAWHPRRWQHFAPGRPSSDGLEVAADAAVLGAQMCVWEQRADSVIPDLLARLPAFAMRLWHGDEPVFIAGVRRCAIRSGEVFRQLTSR